MNISTNHDLTATAVGLVAIFLQTAHGARLWPARSAGGAIIGVAFVAFALTVILTGSEYETRYGQPLWATVLMATALLVVGAGYAAQWLATTLRALSDDRHIET